MAVVVVIGYGNNFATQAIVQMVLQAMPSEVIKVEQQPPPCFVQRETAEKLVETVEFGYLIGPYRPCKVGPSKVPIPAPGGH